MVQLLAVEYPVKANIKFNSISYLIAAGTNSAYPCPPQGTWYEGTIVEPGPGVQGVLHIDGVRNVDVSNLTINLGCCQLEKLCAYGVKVKSDSRNVRLANVRITNGGRNLVSHQPAMGNVSANNGTVRIQDSASISLLSVVTSDTEHSCVRLFNSSVTVLKSVAGLCGKHGFHASRGSIVTFQNSSAVQFRAEDDFPTGCGANFTGYHGHLVSTQVDDFTVWDIDAGGICAKKANPSAVYSKFFEINENKCFRSNDLPQFKVFNNICASDVVYNGMLPN